MLTSYRSTTVSALIAFLAANLAAPSIADGGLIRQGADWRYLDDGSDPGPTWFERDYDDRHWPQGPAELGFGDGDEKTVLTRATNALGTATTYYFRKAFEVDASRDHSVLRLGLVRDDGACVYLNGHEIVRDNLPKGPIDNGTLAATVIGGSLESKRHEFVVPNDNLLVDGQNVLAVEVHQGTLVSSDISFNLDLSSGPGQQQLTRGPYLQCGTPTQMRVCWRTALPCDSVVWLGEVGQPLSQMVSNRGDRIDHVVILDDLLPDTTYRYAVGSASGQLAGQDAVHRFTTSPTPGTAKPTRIWVLGDSGTANDDARRVRDAYHAWNNRQTDLWLMLGDNAYGVGTDAEYQRAVFDLYTNRLPDTVLWSTLGNHDGYSADSATESGPYYDIFNLPRHGEAGGVPSGTEAYYAFDYGNIHFVCLESFETDRSTNGLMMTWLREDLRQATEDWTIAFWHHPPYTKGSHDSDREVELIQMRENVLPTLEAFGVDLVLTGHSHSYERSKLMHGHYGGSETLLPEHVVDGGDGLPAGDGAYNVAAATGTVYVVAGSSGKRSGGPLNHPIMHVSLNELGSLAIDVSGRRMDVRFIGDTPEAKDIFSIEK
ncbi:MAG: metallophosphoesterase family protein [Verrucomicrobia bacterium]|nr:metallophosphoesterase family protein [Verrucomicrobiota bacterium]